MSAGDSDYGVIKVSTLAYRFALHFKEYNESVKKSTSLFCLKKSFINLGSRQKSPDLTVSTLAYGTQNSAICRVRRDGAANPKHDRKKHESIWSLKMRVRNVKSSWVRLAANEQNEKCERRRP